MKGTNSIWKKEANMRSLARRQIEKAFGQKGLVPEEAKGHRKWILLHEGRYTGIFTKISRSPKYKEIDDTTLGRISRQLKFRMLHQFKDFVECPVTQEMYLELLREQHYIL